MSEMTITVLDSDQSIHGRLHGSCAERLIAALSYDPTTITELEAAVTRFEAPSPNHSLFDFFHKGISEEWWDAGVLVIDLTARLAAMESTYFALCRRGAVEYHDGKQATDYSVHYQVPDGWLLNDELEGWQSIATERRAQFQSEASLDARAVLYGNVIEFIVSECQAARTRRTEDPVMEIHANWLQSSRDDLRGQAPRDVLLVHHDFIDFDLQWREHQWSMLGKCPPGLSPDSMAYRFGGFGTHEIVVYYILVRHLIDSYWERMPHAGNADIREEIDFLTELRDKWLYEPTEEFHGMTPYYVIERERARLPVSMPYHQFMVDPDCPLCEMLAESASPGFWHLDGSGMDDDFVFSFHRTREEWEKQRREWEEYNREWKAKREVGSTIDGEETDQFDDLDVEELEIMASQSLYLMLFGIGAHLAEMRCILDASGKDRARWNELRRDFASLRQVLREADGSMLQPLLDKLIEGASAFGSSVPELANRCNDLNSELGRLRELLECGA